MTRSLSKFFTAVALLAATGLAAAQDPLPSWHDGPARSAIIAFVEKVTEEGAPGFVPVAERIATFDNDGTLWSEKPLYSQVFFALDQLHKMAPAHPEWKTTEPYKSALAGDIEGLMAQGEEAVLKLLITPHAGLTAEQFSQAVSEWAATAKNPARDMLFTQMIFQPMLELLDYLRGNGFQTYIVSGGGIDFVRVFSAELYDIPPPQVVGSTLDAKYQLIDGVPTIVKEGKISLVDDKAGKPVGIYRHIGMRPIFAAGNSDGDMAMLEYTTIARDASDTTPRFGLLLRHTDAEREFKYDRESSVGKLDQALDAAPGRGWLVVDMKNDWKRVYPQSP